MAKSLTWPGVLDPGLLKPEVVQRGDILADAAKAGDWPRVLETLDLPWAYANQTRPAGKSWFTPLHQAAWHAAPLPVVEELLRRGALRSLPDRAGRTPYDVARDRDHPLALVDLLRPPPSPMDADRVAALDRHLATVIDGRLTLPGGIAESYQHPLHESLRYPLVAVLHECPGQAAWFAVPGMYGGFRVALRSAYLEVTSWLRVVGGSGQTHVVTHEGVTLVEEGFV